MVDRSPALECSLLWLLVICISWVTSIVHMIRVLWRRSVSICIVPLCIPIIRTTTNTTPLGLVRLFVRGVSSPRKPDILFS
nr:hypothetical protein Iba_scaffold508844CG0030 [Ipomoea batatas]